MIVLAAGTVGVAAASTPTKQLKKAIQAPAGHPTIEFAPLTPQPKDPTAILFAEPSTEGVVPPNQNVIAPLSKLESGVYVNFESTPVMPLAMAGNRLLVTNVPANTLEVLRTDAGRGNQLMVERTIPVGIDPVAVLAPKDRPPATPAFATRFA